MTKHEWRKKEKSIYLHNNEPELIEISEFKFITISGEGNPNSPHFSDCITALYTISYAIKMSPKKMDPKPTGYFDYTVYPLEGIWDVNEAAKQRNDGVLNKDELVFKIMIRQPDFVTNEFYLQSLEITKKKKSNPLLDQLKFESITDGKCIQMMHIGSYDHEPTSFALMEDFALQNGLTRVSKLHREIYISDFRKVSPEKLKTVLRFKVR